MSNIKLTFKDFIPAISGLIGKVSLVASFALVWAKELGIKNENFVFENVRLELLIGSLISLFGILILKNISPAGTLSPLVVMIPFMVKFGVHPLILGCLVGILGIIFIKTGYYKKLINLSGFLTNTSITLVFGISGMIMSIEKLYLFFENKYLAFFLLITSLSLIYFILFKTNKTWLIILFSSLIAIIIPYFFNIKPQNNFIVQSINLSPNHWWNNVWNVGYGLNLTTILKTLPFALFVILLWAVDTLSIQAIKEKNYKHDIEIDNSFVLASIRNIIGSIFGGAQTASLWRSFLIPLFMTGRKIKASAIILCILGITCSLIGWPIHFLSFTPLIWSVLLFGIFIPLIITAIQNLFNSQCKKSKFFIILFSLLGILINPIITWLVSTIYEKNKRNLYY